jgi:VWFA-related protein
MTRLLVACVLAAAFGVVVSPAQTASQIPRSRVLIDAVALDKQNMPVADLKPDDVEVWIGHFRVPIESLELVTPASETRAGRLIVLLLDDISVPLPDMARVQEIARRFVTRLLPGDQMAVVMLNNPTLESTNEPARLRRDIDRYSVRATGVMRNEDLGRQVLKTISGIASGLTEAGDGRKVIIGIGSGWLFDRPLPAPAAGADLLPEWIEAIRALSRSHAAFYVIDPAGVGRQRSDGGQAGFARETGGHAFLGTNDAAGAADRILRETGTYYLMTVPNPPVGGTGLRELEVKSLRKGVTIRARRAIH